MHSERIHPGPSGFGPSAARLLELKHATPSLIGESMPVRVLRNTISKVARTRMPVLITGETGSGKELVACQLHQQSGCHNRPMVAVNCPALPPDLFHAEVFGYEKGAFTGADKRSPGRVEMAEGGSLFLDEIGDLAPSTQVVLLRFLQDGIYERLGSVKPIRSNVRIIAATHVDLEKACRETGQFREDLYYRLNGLNVHVPPLRDRGDDYRLLAEYFLEEYSRSLGLSSHRFSPDALEAMSRYRWPGNVRELKHLVLQSVVMCERRTIGLRDLGLDPNALESRGPAGRPGMSLKTARMEAERNAITNTLRETGGDVCKAAAILEISRAQLYRLIKTHHLKPGGPSIAR